MEMSYMWWRLRHPRDAKEISRRLAPPEELAVRQATERIRERVLKAIDELS
jgi:hypothetical protein